MGNYQVVNWDKVRFQHSSNQPKGFQEIHPKDVPLVQDAVNKFLISPQVAMNAKRKIQEFTTHGDFPAQMNDLLKIIQAVPAYDFGWQEIFDVMDMYNAMGSGMDMASIGSSLTFKLTNIGEKADYYEMNGVNVTIPFEFYSGGLLWHRSLFMFQQYWRLEHNAIEFRNQLYASRARIHYGLIEALPVTQNIAWQVPDPAGLAVTDPVYTANRDAQTINLACQTILLANANKGYSGINPDAPGGTQFIISCPIQLEGRLRKAVALALQAFQGSERSVNWNIKIIPTLLYAATNVYYVILPKNGWAHGNRMAPTTYVKFDQDSLSDASVVWTADAAAITDVTQGARCAIA